MSGTSAIVPVSAEQDWSPAADSDELATQVEEFEAKAQFTHTEFVHYFDAEVELENRIILYSTNCAGALDFNEARSAMDQVIELNHVLRARAERELERVDADDAPYRELLEDAQGLSAGMILHQQGIVQQWHADEALLRGDIAAAQEALASATAYYVELGESSLPQNEVGQARAVVANVAGTFLSAVQALQAGQYSSASENFRRARAGYQNLLDDLGDPEPGEDNATLLGQFRADVCDRVAYARAMVALAAFFDSAVRSDFVEAVRYAESAVMLAENWLEAASALNATPGQINVRRQDLSQFRGWLAWSRAELAVDNQQWDACRTHLREARDAWESGNYIAMRRAARGVVSGGVTNGNNEMLLRSTQYRCDRERRLHEEVARLRTDAQVTAAAGVKVYAHSQSGVDMSQNSGNSSSYNISGGNFQNTAIGDHAQQRSKGPSTQLIVSPGDFRQLADELRALADQLAGAARTPAEHTAADEVREAESQARRGDRPAVLKHLSAAGQWALTIAEKLLLPVAGDAIKQSLGMS